MVDREIKQFSCKMDVPLRLWDVKNNRASGKSVEAQKINIAVDIIRVEVNLRYPLKELNLTFINNFEYFLRTEKKCRTNTIWGYMIVLKHIVSIARNDGRQPFNPIAGYINSSENVDRDYVTKEDTPPIACFLARPLKLVQTLLKEKRSGGLAVSCRIFLFQSVFSRKPFLFHVCTMDVDGYGNKQLTESKLQAEYNV